MVVGDGDGEGEGEGRGRSETPMIRPDSTSMSWIRYSAGLFQPGPLAKAAQLDIH